MTPEVEALGIAAIRAARWVVDGPLVAGCVHDSGEAVRQAVVDAVRAVRAADSEGECCTCTEASLCTNDYPGCDYCRTLNSESACPGEDQP